MKRKIIAFGLLAIGVCGYSQVSHVAQTGIFYIGETALVYNGGGVESKGNGVYDVHGNVMIVGSGSDAFRTYDTSGGNKTTGGNFILRLNNPANAAASTYGQLYIDGISQGNLTGIIDKEYRTPKNGTYQQVAIPFFEKRLYTLSTELGKTFTNVRWSKNEVLVWNNALAVSDYWSVNNNTFKNTSYYMLGSANLDTGNPPATMVANYPTTNGTVYTIKGRPLAAGITETLQNAAATVNFGVGGNNLNSYNEKYNSYIQDAFDASSGVWTNNYGKNIYQFGNPFFTNLDLSKIGFVEQGTNTDGNNITTIQGIRYDPGSVQSLPSGATYSTGAKYILFDTTQGSPTLGQPVGDITGAIIKPMNPFVIKLTSAASQTLLFDKLRRFEYSSRLSGTNYSVTANRGAAQVTMKQLGVIALDANKKEIARTYYVVYPNGTSGHTPTVKIQATLGSGNKFGTFEEDPVNGGYDMNYVSSYWLYINEANENDFFGKAIPLALYTTDIKYLKFEVSENAHLLDNGVHELSTGIGFYYRNVNGGNITEVRQNEIVPVTNDEYSLYYGKSINTVLGTGATAKPSLTKVIYNEAIDSFVVRFDDDWKSAEIYVYDLSGKLIMTKKDVKTSSDFILNIPKVNSGYLVTAISEKGVKASSKTIR